MWSLKEGGVGRLEFVKIEFCQKVVHILGLRKKKAISSPHNLHLQLQEIMKVPKAFQWKMRR